jgi:hypothetical protein
MRFPASKSETERLILAAIDGGVNFFDTAYIYPNSEATLGRILAKHNRRADVFIATKLPLSLASVKDSSDFERIFAEQLRRLQTDYIDYYFMHNMTSFDGWEHLKSIEIEQWLEEKKAAGAIRQVGFSYHGSSDEFPKILHGYDWDFCMIQYNYYDENYQAGRAGLLAAAQRGIPVMVMEPLLGGRLATGLPKNAVKAFAAANPDITPAEHAFRWLWNQPQVTVVLSGMSSTAIMEANITAAREFRPLTDTELSVYADVVQIFRKAYKINCTGCNYCLPCPKGINIPGVFSAYNARYVQGFVTGVSLYLMSTAAFSKHPLSARRCNGCGKCERACPQNLAIRRDLKRTARKLEPLPIRAVVAIVRKFLR